MRFLKLALAGACALGLFGLGAADSAEPDPAEVPDVLFQLSQTVKK